MLGTCRFAGTVKIYILTLRRESENENERPCICSHDGRSALLRRILSRRQHCVRHCVQLPKGTQLHGWVAIFLLIRVFAAHKFFTEYASMNSPGENNATCGCRRCVVLYGGIKGSTTAVVDFLCSTAVRRYFGTLHNNPQLPFASPHPIPRFPGNVEQTTDPWWRATVVLNLPNQSWCCSLGQTKKENKKLYTTRSRGCSRMLHVSPTRYVRPDMKQRLATSQLQDRPADRACYPRII